jgi:hypothetical protein
MSAKIMDVTYRKTAIFIVSTGEISYQAIPVSDRGGL